MLGLGKAEAALAVLQKDAERYPDTWPVAASLARGFSAAGDTKKALKHARAALAQAPDNAERTSVEEMIEKLKAGRSLDSSWATPIPSRSCGDLHLPTGLTSTMFESGKPAVAMSA